MQIWQNGYRAGDGLRLSHGEAVIFIRQLPILKVLPHGQGAAVEDVAKLFKNQLNVVIRWEEIFVLELELDSLLDLRILLKHLHVVCQEESRNVSVSHSVRI